MKSSKGFFGRTSGVLSLLACTMPLAGGGMVLHQSAERASAQDCVTGGSDYWIGEGADNNYTTDGNWDDGSNPGYLEDACLVYPTGTGAHTSCDWDFAAQAVGDIMISGSEPSFFTLFVTDYNFKPGTLDLRDYAFLDVDCCLQVTSAPTKVAGRTRIEVGTGATCCLNGVEPSPIGELELVGSAKANQVTIDAHAVGGV